MNRIFVCMAVLLVSSNLMAQPASSEAQIKSALLACPEDQRAQATVYGYDAQGKFVVLRKGTGDMICIADDPAAPEFQVSAYHKSLEPFMARGRELKAAGKNQLEILQTREADVKAGKFSMPSGPTTLFVYYGPSTGYNMKTGEVTGASFRYVIYIPYATAATTGLPTKPEAPGMPWLMDAGTHRAHIMITPPAGKN